MTAPRPDFICIGAPKSGTSWLYDALSAQPGVFIIAAKGSNYFDREYHRGADWYARHFAAAPQAAIRGEISHDYYSDPDAPARIAADLPEVKLILILREPGDFIASNIRWLIAHTKSYGDGVEGIWANPEIKRNADYLTALDRYRTLFPGDRLRVLFYEALKEDPDRFLDDVLTHIGARDRAGAPERRVNPTRGARSPVLMRGIFAIARLARSAGFGGLVERVKRSPALTRLLYSDEAPPLTEVEAARLAEIQSEVRALNAAAFDRIGELAGAPVPQVWRDRV